MKYIAYKSNWYKVSKTNTVWKLLPKGANPTNYQKQRKLPDNSNLAAAIISNVILQEIEGGE